MNRHMVRQMLLVLGSAVILGVVAGLIWWRLAEPGQWEVRENGIALTEEQSQGEFQVVAMFTLVGAIAALTWAVAVFRPFRESGWQLVITVLIGSTLAAVVAWQVGMTVGPPEPATVSGLAVGDVLPDRLAVYGIAPFLVWPIAAMIGVLLATWGMGRADPDADYERETNATAAPVIDTRS
jgi:H+/Cl- antiporter ClcA